KQIAKGALPATTKEDATVTLKVIVGEMKFDQEIITAKAGTVLKIRLENPDFMLRNLLILEPGSLQKVGKASDELAQSPSGAEKQYVPGMKEVLCATPLVTPESNFEFVIRVPEGPGDYPFVCTFPGQWRMMNG